MSRSVLVAALAILLLGPARPAGALPGRASPAFLARDFVPGELLVKFRARASAQRRLDAVASFGHAQLASLGGQGWAQVQAAPGQTVAEAVAAYAGHPDVEWAQPNFVYRATAAPNDPHYPLMWGLNNTGQNVAAAPTQPAGSGLGYSANNPGTPAADMNLEAAWTHITDCSSVVVAVVDSGVNYTHQDLAANMWNGGPSHPNHGKSFVTSLLGDDATMDLNGHGTHVAGTIGAVGNNSVGATGVCWKATLMAVRVLDEAGSGSTSSIMQGIDFAVANGAKVINMSLGGTGGFDQAFSDTLSAAQAADVLVVVAAGNDGLDNDAMAPGLGVYPCNFDHPNLVCVAALDQGYQRASFSNWGAASVDVGAPGTNIVSAWPGPVTGDPLFTGWSFASTTSVTGHGWDYSTGITPQSLVNPSTFWTGNYAASTDDRVWKSFNVTGATAAVLHFQAALNVAAGDYASVAWASTAVDPFGPGGTVVATTTGVADFLDLFPYAFDVSGCIGATCTVGFQLLTDGLTQDIGIAITRLTLGTAVTNAASYNTINGTSMASPGVAGVAAMLRAYNPLFNHADVAAALKRAGPTVSALAGVTTSGRAVDAMRTLAFVNPPTGLAAVVQ